jgi:hypothetical protein
MEVFSAGHSRRIEFECVRDAKAGHGLPSFKGKTAGAERKQSPSTDKFIFFFRGAERTKLKKNTTFNLSSSFTLRQTRSHKFANCRVTKFICLAREMRAE